MIGKSVLCSVYFPSMQLIPSSEISDEDKQDPGNDRMDEDTIPPKQANPDDLSVYNLDNYDNEASDTGMPM